MKTEPNHEEKSTALDYLIYVILFTAFLFSSYDTFLSFKVKGFTIRAAQLILIIFISIVFIKIVFIEKRINLPLGINFLIIWTFFILLFIPNTSFLLRNIGYGVWMLFHVVLILFFANFVKYKNKNLNILKLYIISFFINSFLLLIFFILLFALSFDTASGSLKISYCDIYKNSENKKAGEYSYTLKAKKDKIDRKKSIQINSKRRRLLSGQTYTFSAFVYVPEQEGLYLDDIYLTIFDTTGKWKSTDSNSPTVFDEWQKISVTRTIRSNAYIKRIKIMLADESEKEYYFYIDDLRIEETKNNLTEPIDYTETKWIKRALNRNIIIEQNINKNRFLHVFWKRNIPRLSLFSYEPSFFATYLIAGLILTICLWIDNHKIFKKRNLFWLTVMLVVELVALLLTNARSGFVVLFLFIVYLLAERVYLCVKRKKFDIKLIIFLCFCFGGAFFVFYLFKRQYGTNVISRIFGGTGIFSTRSGTFTGRVSNAKETFKVFLKNPFIGVSLGGIPAGRGELIGKVITSQSEAKHLEGIVVLLEVLAASGVVGFIFFALYFIKLSFKPLFENNVLLKALAISLIFQFIMLQFNQNIQRLYFWLHVAVLSMAYQVHGKSKERFMRFKPFW